MKKYILGAVLSLGILITPAASYAAGLTNVQISSILSLLSAFGADSATIANVTTALNGGTPSSGNGSAFCHTFATDLTVGSTGSEVLALNQALSFTTLTLSDHVGNSIFNENTAADVVQFQGLYGIRQTGYAGPMTRAKLNALYGCSTTPTPLPTPTPAPAPSTPTITGTAAKGAGNLEVDAGGQVSIYGSSLAGNTISSTKVVIGGIAATVTYASDTTVTANVPGSLTAGQTYTLYVSNEKGKSNTVIVTVLSVLGSSVSTAPPVITSTSAKAAGNLEMDAGGTATISGTNLSSTSGLPSVYIGGAPAAVTYVSDTMLWINVPSTLAAGQSYALYVVNSHGTSNTLTVKILSVFNVAPVITFANKDPNPNTGAVTLLWQTSNPANVALDMVCNSGPINFSTDQNSNPTCSKGGVWVWYGQTSGSILMTPSGNTKPVTVSFTLTILDESGTYTAQKQQLSVTFPAAVQAPAPYVTSTFSYKQGTGSGSSMNATYTYQIQNYRSGLVLDIEPTVNCNDVYLAPYKRDCSQYWLNLSGKAAESYSNVQANPYVKGGASYRFTGSSGLLNLNGFINPSYVPGNPYISPSPDNINYTFYLRDLNQAGTTIWSQTQTAQFKG
jgi:hypothetical protein